MRVGSFTDKLPGAEEALYSMSIPMCLLVRMHPTSCFLYYFRGIKSQGLARVTKTGGLGVSVGPLAWRPKGEGRYPGSFLVVMVLVHLLL